MRIDVFFGSQALTPADVSGRVIAVIDVLRASTSIAVALANGAKSIIPFDSPEEAVTRRMSLDKSDVRLAGERKMLMIPGFDLGNSPREFTPEAIEGKTVLMVTTNGTGSLTAVQGARDVVVASFVNFSAVLALLRTAARGGTDIAIICSGRDRQFSLEDAACAGRYARQITRRMTGTELNDAARAAMLIDKKYGDNIAKLFQDSTHGRALTEAGFAEDVAMCAVVDSYSVVPIYHDRQVTKLGPERER